jgi:hypothetical protein
LTTLASEHEIVINIHASITPAVVGNKFSVELKEFLHDLVIHVGNTAFFFNLSPNVPSGVQEDVVR